MNGGKKNEHPQQKGLFLFFLLGLFILQISFAFTIHGDIGPQASLNQKLQRVAPPQLMGKIDSILQPESSGVRAATTAPQKNSSPKPETPVSIPDKTAVKPAQPSSHETPAVSAKAKAPSKNLALKAKDERFFEYTITGGDTLEAISRRLCGSGKMVNALIRANRLQNERALRCGERLLVPRSMVAKN